MPTAWCDASPCRADQELVASRRRDANRIGFAVQLALLRHPGIALTQLEQPVEPLVQWMARQLDIPAAPFANYAHRPQTLTDHARELAVALRLRPSANSDLPMVIEAAAKAAWSTDHGCPIAGAVIAALRLVASLKAGTVLPSAMLKRLAAFQRQNQLDFALQELGRLERCSCSTGWNRPAPATVPGRFEQERAAARPRPGDLHVQAGAQQFGRQQHAVPVELLAHTSPLTWEHIGFSGDFLWDQAATTAGKRRPLNLSQAGMAA